MDPWHQNSHRDELLSVDETVDLSHEEPSSAWPNEDA